MKNKKYILAITGIRSEYFIMKPLLKAINNSNNFYVKLVVSGAHLSEIHGNTKSMIEQDKFTIVDCIDSLLNTNRSTQRAKGTGLLITALSQTVEREKPDFLMVLGDREESIATAIVANYMNIPNIHIGGGDAVSGNSDDPVRFAVSKLSHLHCTLSKEHSNNLIKIGEPKHRVKFIGNPAYDEIKNIPHLSIKEISNQLNFEITKNNYLIFLKHPLSSEIKEVKSQITKAFNSLITFCEKYNFKIIGIYPNSDPGSEKIIAFYKSINHPLVKIFPTIENKLFVNLLRNSRALVGNSSLGILEAPFYKLPVVNIGNRQKGRINAGNVIFTSYSANSINNALEKSCFDKNYQKTIKSIKSIYGTGRAGEELLKFLSKLDPKCPKLLTKIDLV